METNEQADNAAQPDGVKDETAQVVDNDAPRSTSSAMPDLTSATVPRLQARVHQRLTVEQCQRISLSDLRFRAVRPADQAEMVALHTEWFPVSYEEGFYNKAVQGDIFTLVATYSGNASSSSAVLSTDSKSPKSVTENKEGGDEDILGMITMSMSCEFHSEDIQHVLGGDCATLCREPSRTEDRLTAAENGNAGRHGKLAYILTLGVTDGFRRRGLARELLHRAIGYVEQELPQVQAVYLHVVTYNDAAVKLYEGAKFMKIGRFNEFYFLHGKPYDSFLYAHYVNNGRAPWKLRWRAFLGFTENSTWREWASMAWNSLWRTNALQDGTSLCSSGTARQ